ncbi:thiamine phosphate synthase [Polaromonas sp.]|uniref:thiamine phosphate synthase n=1 Tax=Polaromonas sp. TaxID=1869339 RepID=UPI0037524E00
MNSTVWTFVTNAQQIQQRILQISASPGPVLLCLNRHEAATLLGLPTLGQPEIVAQAAARLRSALGASVVITGEDGDYADTPQASGWLSYPSRRLTHAGGDNVFVDAVTRALTQGFVVIDALVIACMARSDALSQTAGTISLQPRPDFAQRSDNLPFFSLPQATTVSGFAALSDADLDLYAVVDSADWVARVVAAGVRTVQLRIKDAEGEQHSAMVREEIRQSIRATTATGAQLFINDHWQLAIEEGAYGVHLGQEDLHIADLAAISQAGLRLGISTHAYWEVCRAWALQPSYIACGPIHPTQAKAMPWIPQGNDNLAYWCKLLPVPVVGIAGMDVARTEEAAACGAAGVAVISGITAAASPETAIDQLQEALRRGRSGPSASAPLLPKSTLSPSV